jgi:maltose alpha-D-glucosyltransferase/alpha-amylase
MELLSGDASWFKDAVIYQIPMKSFNDSSGDGFGDIRGVIEKLDYLRDLGVDCLWIMPMYPSPGKDDGYDISDFTSIDPKLRDGRRFRRPPHPGAHARPPGGCRPDLQPFLRPAPMVPGRPR